MVQSSLHSKTQFGNRKKSLEIEWKRLKPIFRHTAQSHWIIRTNYNRLNQHYDNRQYTECGNTSLAHNGSSPESRASAKWHCPGRGRWRERQRCGRSNKGKWQCQRNEYLLLGAAPETGPAAQRHEKYDNNFYYLYFIVAIKNRYLFFCGRAFYSAERYSPAPIEY